jgi:two-component system, OmpR family, phosphate regulon sensor histidine kinase PhoR
MKSLATKFAAISFLLVVFLLAILLLIVGFVTRNQFQGHRLLALSNEADQITAMLRHDVAVSPSFRRATASIRNVFQPADGKIYLLNSSGTVLYDSSVPDDSLPSTGNQFHASDLQQSLLQEPVDGEKANTTDDDTLYTMRLIDPPLLLRNESRIIAVRFVQIDASLRGIEEIVATERKAILIPGSIFLIVVVAVGFIIAKRLISPIARIEAIAQEIRQGNISKRITLSANDELSKLAVNLNSMLDKLQADIAQLKKLERFRSEFLGNVTHELRTPIFAIQGLIETLLHGALDDPKVNKDFLEKALRNTDRLNVLLADLIDISRIESGEMKLSFRYFDLRSFLAATVNELSSAAEQKKIALQLEGQAKDEVEVYGDRDRLRQVMINLVDNAIKYSESGSTIVISTLEKEDHVEVSVADSGIGIPEEHLPRIFERFYRVDKDRSREVGGTGLGLAIVKHILEAHHSSITVKSEVGKGSNFTFNVKK